MKFKFSLRLFAALFTLIAILLGAREAVRSYHWHRNLPVSLHIQSEDRDSQETSVHVKARFGQAEVDRVRKAAAKQREEVAKQQFDDLVSTKNDRFYRHNGYHSAPYYFHGPRFRSALQERVRTWFFRNPDLSDDRQLELLTYLFETNDPAAFDFISEVLAQDATPNIHLVLKVLKSGWFRHTWYEDHEKFHRSMAKYLKTNQIPGEMMDWLVWHDIPLTHPEIINILGSRDRIELKPETTARLSSMGLSPSEMEDYVAAEKLAARVRWLAGSPPGYLPRDQIVPLLRLLAAEAKEIVDTPQFESAEIRDTFVLALAEIASGFRGAGESHKEPCAELADLAFQLNCYLVFLIAAGDSARERINWIYENRKSLVQPLPWEFDEDADGSLNKLLHEDTTVGPIPYPRSGLDCPIQDDFLAMALWGAEKEFARPKLLQLMKEGVSLAFVGAGDCWEGTDDDEVVELLRARLSEVRSKLTGKRSDWELEQEAFEVYESLKKVSIWAATQVVPAERPSPGVAFVEPEGTIEEMRECFTAFGLRVPDGYEWDHDREATSVFIMNQRFAHIVNGDLEAQCESLLNASVGIFEPDVHVHPSDSGSQHRLVEVALDHCVYQFPMRIDCKTHQLVLCDVFNHILERQHLEYRFLTSHSDECYFGKPELFKQLSERFEIRFLRGAEAYFPSGS